MATIEETPHEIKETSEVILEEISPSDPPPHGVGIREEEERGVVGADEQESGARSHHGLVGEEKKIPEWPSVLRDGWVTYIKRSLDEIFLSSKLNVLLIFVPISILCQIIPWTSDQQQKDVVLFTFSLLALCPLAERISFVTEDLAKYTNDTIGGLMNASMGNVPELIMSCVALQKGKLRVVQLSLLGSILSNLLLVLGTAFALGGTRLKTQQYNKSAATTNSAILLLMVFALLMPSSLDATNTAVSEEDMIILSRTVSAMLLIVYGGLIYYQLKTHTHLFEGVEDDEDEPPVLGVWGAVFWMGVSALLIALLSEFAIGAIEGAAKKTKMSQFFIAAILLPIVGNAAEHASAIIFALRNRMEISLGVAVGSSAQISMFVIPLLVLLAWPFGQPLSLDFHVFETVVVAMTVIVVGFVIQHGESDWLKGVVLLTAYLITGISFWYHIDIGQ
mmetsp:Transcript_25050/g.34584  ORF Transcript_25050/g.34584 Transcript_25050/m.34584 type:complete len:449 (-) Transcript_25050:26-1372(-)|eukprot:CAMPEP_0201491716 /NCGR_PEP_ID=MMETSP0151_2-20130828/30927_1 /ASSEMBLY_ACC=CAM_ASM_000257 /TAXON_ID=200890 /ORGANISM="Paramoeba atlantica, Strain 621/1 / CCAP 1560/9" /LENGTH=448 /DNA_ID=CAMNT_0047878201 /DNA_START=67 /DNA_END=1413 /DNA_ORIENTATION=+